MASGDSSGILPLLGMQQQQSQGGLLGALGDPETMAYIAMMLKGASPYSNLDPNSMLSNAHTVAMRRQAMQQQLAEQARDNARADARLGMDRERHAFTRGEHEARTEEIRRQREADQRATEATRGATEGSATIPTQAKPTQGETEPSYETEDRTAAGIGLTPREEGATPEAVASEPVSRRVQLEQRLESMYKGWDTPDISDKRKQSFKMEIDRIERQLGMSPSEQRTYKEAQELKGGAEAAIQKVDKAVELLQNPNLYEGFRKTASGAVENIIGGSNMTKDARETGMLSRIMSVEGLQELAKHLKPLSEREGALIRELENNPGMSLGEKKWRMEALQTEINKRKTRSQDTISDLEERERPGTSERRRSSTPSGGGGGSDPLNIR